LRMSFRPLRGRGRARERACRTVTARGPVDPGPAAGAALAIDMVRRGRAVDRRALVWCAAVRRRRVAGEPVPLSPRTGRVGARRPPRSERRTVDDGRGARRRGVAADGSRLRDAGRHGGTMDDTAIAGTVSWR